MDFGLIDIPQSKWDSGTGRQVILKGDFAKIEAAILQSFGLLAPPTIQYVDATSIKVPATENDIAPIMMTGFPSVLHPGMFVSAGLTDGRYRENTTDVVMDFDLATNLYGTEKASQWFVVYAVAGNVDPAFKPKAMPYMRVTSQADQVISLGTLVTPATGIGYGFTTDELAGSKIYVLTGASRGLVRAITANNNNNTSGGTISYGGTALTLTQGDWFIVLPNTNFRVIGEIFNNSAGNIDQIIDLGDMIQWVVDAVHSGIYNGTYVESITMCSPLATSVRLGSPTGIAIGHPDIGYGGSPYTLTAIPPSTTADTTVKFCRFSASGSSGGSNIYRVAYRKPRY